MQARHSPNCSQMDADSKILKVSHWQLCQEESAWHTDCRTEDWVWIMARERKLRCQTESKLSFLLLFHKTYIPSDLFHDDFNCHTSDLCVQSVFPVLAHAESFLLKLQRVQISIILNGISASEQNQSHLCHYQIIFSDNPRSGQPRQLFIVICVELTAFESLVKAHQAAQNSRGHFCSLSLYQLLTVGRLETLLLVSDIWLSKENGYTSAHTEGEIQTNACGKVAL